MKVTTVGLDLAKSVSQAHGADARGQAVWSKRLRRDQVLKFFARLEPCVVGMEACGGAHYWGRELERLGHTVRLISPQHVRPFVKANKNDARDAEAIVEALSRPSTPYVSLKNEEQQAVLALHRVREGLVQARTAQANQLRGLLAEFGLVMPRGLSVLLKGLAQRLEGARLPQMMCTLALDAVQRIRDLDAQAKRIEREILAWHRGNEASRRLDEIPGIGLLGATALVAHVGNARQFARARTLPAWLGLTPREHSSGERRRLLGITKHGNSYLRWLLIHGARAVLRQAERRPKPEHRWLLDLARRRNRNIATVALANKNARIAWALLTRDKDYEPAPSAS